MTSSVRSSRLDLLGILGAVLCCALWGGNAVAVKFAISRDGLPAFTCATMRFVLCLPIVYWTFRRRGEKLVLKREDAWLYLTHGLITALQIGSYNWGTSHSEAGRSSVFINVHPLVVAPMAWLVLGEHLGTRGVFGLTSAALGVFIILFQRLTQGGGLVGDLVVLVSGIVFGLQTIAQKLTFKRIPPMSLLLIQTILAIPFSLGAALLFEMGEPFHLTRESVWGLLYQGLAVSGLCFSLWMILLDRYQASALATVAFLTPLFGLTFSNLTRGDSLTPSLVVGACLVGLGIYLVASGRRRATEASSASE